MIKRSLQFLAPLVLVVALGACGSDSKKSASTTAATAGASTVAAATTTGGAATGNSTATDGSTATDATGVDATTAGSGSTGGSAPGAGTDFCNTNNDLNDALSGSEDATEGLVVLKQFEPKYDGFIADAPADLKANATTLVGSARKAIAGNDANILVNDPDFPAALTAIDTYCGYAL